MRLLKNLWFARFARREKISDALLWEAVDRAERGAIDADLGGGVIKQRVARAGQGKSGGFRTLILYRTQDRAVFVFGFAKSQMGNIDRADLLRLRKSADLMLGLSAAAITKLVEAGQLEEVIRDGETGQKISE